MSISEGPNGRKIVTTVRGLPPLETIFRKRRILITGGTGFLGKVLLYLLLRHHPEIGRIFLLIRGDKKSSQNRFRREILDSPALAPLRDRLGKHFDAYVEERVAVVAGDITEPGLITEGAEELGDKPLDAVVHCAGLVNFEASLEKAYAINVTGVNHVIEFCRRHKAALLHVSTCYAAGAADGHRYEDDIPIDWAPRNQNRFNLKREIRAAMAVIERLEAESHDPVRQAEFVDADEFDENANEDQPDERGNEGRRKRWLEEQLKQVGRERSIAWGWPNTYSYTKSVGEQLVLAAGDELAVTVARPSVIEGALRDPHPGWNQGVNTSAPLTYMSGRGYRFYPAKADLVLDVIPVDLAAHAMIPILGALLLHRHKPIYQLCTSDVNPLPMRRLVELTGLANRVEHRRHGGPMGKLAPHLEAVVVSQNTYELASKSLPTVLKQAASLATTLMGPKSSAARGFEKQVDNVAANADLARSLVDVYRPYIQDLVYTFHGRNIRELYKALTPADAEAHDFKPEAIDWRDYWINIHLPGLRQHIFPQLDLHTRTRPRATFRHKTLTELLDSASERYGATTALEVRQPSGQRTALSYREMRDAAFRAGLALRSRGIKAGDRVLLISENSPDWVISYFAILYAGAIAVPLDHLISGDELAPICRIAEPSAALLSSNCAKRLGSAVIDAAGDIPALSLDELQRPFMLRGKLPPLPVADRKTLASIVFTSGTTGAPKGVMLSHGNFTAEVKMLGRVFALDGNDVVLSLLPLHHTFEFTCGMLLPLASGARIVYPLGVDASSLARTFADVRPTAVIAVPALWEAIHRRIIDQVEARGPFFEAAFGRLRELNRRLDEDYHLNLGSLLFRQAHSALGGRLKLAVSGGAALPQRVAEFFNDLGLKLLEGYGLTETAPVLSVARPDEPMVAGSVGKPLSGIELKLDDPDENGVGEIIVRGPNVMSGYYRNAEATAEIIRDGWLHTGDLGRFDAEGRLSIVGRAKDVIVDSGGNNVYIDELEETYGHSPYIKEMAVVGLKAAMGEQVAALVVPAYARGESRRAVEDRLREHFEKVSGTLSLHKRIRILRFSDHELPRTRTRKVKRPEVVSLIERMLDRSKEERSATASEEIAPWLSEALQQFATETTELTPATRLIEDLGLDSLALAELAEQIAVQSELELSADQLSNISTIGDLQKLLDEGQNRPRLPSYAHLARPYTPVLPQMLRRFGDRLLQRSMGAAFEGWLKPTILGRGNIPANRNFLAIANHASHADFGLVTHALGVHGRELVVLAAKDYFFNNDLRRLLATNFTHLIPFDRERAQLESLEEALTQLRAGRSVLMFPEGTRSPDGQIHDFKSGSGYLALHGGCDVLPIRITGTHEVLGKGSLLPKRAPVEVRIGAPILSAEIRAIAESAEGAGAYRKLADFMRDTVIGLTARRKRIVFKIESSGELAHAKHRAPRKQAKG